MNVIENNNNAILSKPVIISTTTNQTVDFNGSLLGTFAKGIIFLPYAVVGGFVLSVYLIFKK